LPVWQTYVEPVYKDDGTAFVDHQWPNATSDAPETDRFPNVSYALLDDTVGAYLSDPYVQANIQPRALLIIYKVSPAFGHP
jgi:hypothetical protein